jgi:large subunit ribosomal protein L13
MRENTISIIVKTNKEDNIMASFTAGTYSAKPGEVERNWHLIDADGLVLGRLAAEITKVLRGKHKSTFTPHINCGDHVVVINAEKVLLTGKKMSDKKYYRHTGHPGGIKETTAGKVISGRFPERLIKLAVKRMMPKESPLARTQFSQLHVYAGVEHKHEGQKPVKLDIAGQNRKNKK